MLIVRHSVVVDAEGSSHEKYWLGNLDASADDVVGSLDVVVDGHGACLSRVEFADGLTDDLQRRRVGSAIREIVGKGVTTVLVPEPPCAAVVEELARLGFQQHDLEVWRVGGAG